MAQPLDDCKILVVDDDDDVRRTFVMLLEAASYQVSAAVDGNDALEKAAEEAFDVILLDIMMPLKNGLDTLQELKADPQKYGKPHVLILTNVSTEETVETAMELGAHSYLIKVQIDIKALLRQVSGFCRGE